MEKLSPGTKLQVGSHEVEIVKYLAEGGFAHIYTVKPTPTEDGYEIACLKRVIVKSKPELNLLRKEVDTMKRLANNRFVVKYYDSNAQKLDNGTYEVLLLMEYCPNKSLLDLMNQHLKTKLSVAQILKIMYEISIAVSAMHSINLIHRDLKVENVLIDANGEFKLADFGSTSGYISPPKNQEEFQMVAHDILYQTTPQYRAPEMIDLYKNIPIDYKSDIWALGVFLYKLMYYTTPFELQGELAILHGYFQFPSAPKYPSRLKNLVIIMLQVDVNLRPNIYQVIHELSSMLEKDVPIEDFYGLGPYNYENYAKYQQQLQYQQQQMQQQQVQQQHLQQQAQQQHYQNQNQKFMEQQQQQQQQQVNQPAHISQQNVSELQEQKVETSVSAQKKDDTSEQFSNSPHAPQQLTRSTNPSSGDLQSLAYEEESPLGDEKTPDPILRQPVGGHNDTKEHKEDAELDSVEERYPSLEDLEESSVEKRFPDVNTFDSEVESKARKSMDELRSQTSDAKSSVEITRNASKKSQPSTITTQEVDEEEAPKPGIKMSQTEAWETSAAEPKANVDLDGVFHTQSNKKSLEESRVNSMRKSGEYGERKSFESGASRKSFETAGSNPYVYQNPISQQPQTIPAPQYQNSHQHQVSPQKQPKPQVQPNAQNAQQPQQPLQYVSPPSNPPPIYYGQGNQPLPQQKFSSNEPNQYFYPQQISQSQKYQSIPTQQQQHGQYSASQSRPTIRGSRNPFPQQGSKNPFPTSKSSLDVKSQPIAQEKSGGNPWAEYTQDTSNLNAQQKMLLQQPKPAMKPYSTNSVPKVSNPPTFDSPKIKVTTSENLIDIDDIPKPAKTRDPKQPHLNLDLLELDMSEPETFDDSLKVEEMKVKPKKKRLSNQSQSSPSNMSARKSSELSRINLDLEELDLDDENNENALADDENPDSGTKHSRRSLTLNRTRSKTSKPKDESRKSSFLGFKTS